MKVHTSQFKEQINKLGRELDSKITFGETVLGKEELNAVTPTFQSSILKSAMKQLDIDSNVEIALGTILRYEFGVKVNGEYEYLNFGNYIVYKAEKQEDTKSYKLICYDKMLYSMKEYESVGVNYPITIREYINALCSHLGLVFADENKEFANYDKIIPNELYLDSEGNSLGYTFRDVFDELAQATASTICLNKNDEVEIRYINDTSDTIDEEYLKDTNINFGEKYGKINSIVLSRASESDNVYLRDEQSVEQNGLCELKIIDNQIMNGNDRSDYLVDILTKLNGLEYYINDFVSTGICYYDICDRYNVQIDDNVYSCVMFNDEILITQGLEENIYTETPEQTKTDYTKADKTDRKINQTYIIVDKQNQEIQALASKVVDVSFTTSGIGSVQLENAHEGILHKLSIAGNLTKIFPSETTYPDDNLYPIEFQLQIDENLYNLDIDYLSYMNADTFDEFIYEDGNCYIIRRVGINEGGEMYKLESEIKEQRKSTIINVVKDSVIILLGFANAIMTATYLTQNQYTDVFTPQVEVKSEIKIATDEINLEVEKKVDEDKVVSALNLSPEKVILKSNRLIIESTNFKLDEFGNMTCENAQIIGSITSNDGEIGGWIINNEGLTNGTLFIKSNGYSSIYTFADIVILRNYLLERIDLNDAEIAHYDLNGDGRVDSIDLLQMQRMILGEQ